MSNYATRQGLNTMYTFNIEVNIYSIEQRLNSLGNEFIDVNRVAVI